MYHSVCVYCICWCICICVTKVVTSYILEVDGQEWEGRGGEVGVGGVEALYVCVCVCCARIVVHLFVGEVGRGVVKDLLCLGRGYEEQLMSMNF